MNKKGLSDIITTVLIILIALAAIILIWTFIRGLLEKSGEQIETTTLISSQLKIDSESVRINETEKRISFTLKRDSGDDPVTGYVAVFTDINGQSKSLKIRNASFSELEAKEIVLNYSSLGISNVSQIAIAPIILKNGKEIITRESDSYTINSLSNGAVGSFGSGTSGSGNNQNTGSGNNNNTGSSQCSNVCSSNGARQCSGSNAFQICGDYNSDGCLEWGTITQCSVGQTCQNGQCFVSNSGQQAGLNWLEYRHDSGRSGYTPANGPTSNATVVSRAISSYDFSGEIFAANGKLYVANSQSIYGIDATTLNTEWTYPFATSGYNKMVVSPQSNMLFVVGGYYTNPDQYVPKAVGISLSSSVDEGAIIAWRTIAPSSWGFDYNPYPMVDSQGNPYFVGHDNSGRNRFIKLSYLNGSIISVTGDSDTFYIYGSSSAIFNGSKIIVFDSSSRANIYSTSTLNRTAISSDNYYLYADSLLGGPTQIGNRVYISSRTNNYPLVTEITDGGSAGNVVPTATKSSSIIGYTYQTGISGGPNNLIYAVQYSSINYPNYGTYTVPKILALDKSTTGLNKIWEFDPNTPFTGNLQYITGDSVVSGNGMVYFKTNTRIYALNALTGALVWNYGIDEVITSSLTVYNGKLYFGTNNGKIYSIG